MGEHTAPKRRPQSDAKANRRDRPVGAMEPLCTLDQPAREAGGLPAKIGGRAERCNFTGEEANNWSSWCSKQCLEQKDICDTWMVI